MTVDRYGNIFTAGSGNIYRYDCEDGSTKHVLSSGFRVSSLHALAVSADGQTVFFAENGTKIYGVDPENGAASVIAELSSLGSPAGMAIYEPSRANDIHVDIHIDLHDFAELANCWEQPALGARLCACRPADLDRDGRVEFSDYVKLIQDFTGPSD